MIHIYIFNILTFSGSLESWESCREKCDKALERIAAIRAKETEAAEAVEKKQSEKIEKKKEKDKQHRRDKRWQQAEDKKDNRHKNGSASGGSEFKVPVAVPAKTKPTISPPPGFAKSRASNVAPPPGFVAPPPGYKDDDDNDSAETPPAKKQRLDDDSSQEETADQKQVQAAVSLAEKCESGL